MHYTSHDICRSVVTSTELVELFFKRAETMDCSRNVNLYPAKVENMVSS